MAENKNFINRITIDPHISIGHIFTTFSAIFAGVWAYASVEYRIRGLEAADVRFERQIADSRKEYNYALDRISIQLEKINDKLDRKADK